MRISGIFAQQKMLKIKVPFNSAYISTSLRCAFYHKKHCKSIKKSRHTAGTTSQPIRIFIDS